MIFHRRILSVACSVDVTFGGSGGIMTTVVLPMYGASLLGGGGGGGSSVTVCFKRLYAPV